jgi:hypothetical protein
MTRFTEYLADIRQDKCMRNKPDDSFKEFVLDQLGALPELCARAMLGETFFGILEF